MFSGTAQYYKVGIFADLKCKNSTHWATQIMNNDIINIPVYYHQASKFLHVGLLANPQFFLWAQCRSQFYFIKLGQRVLKTCTFNMLHSKLTKSEALSTAPVSCDIKPHAWQHHFGRSKDLVVLFWYALDRSNNLTVLFGLVGRVRHLATCITSHRASDL